MAKQAKIHDHGKWVILRGHKFADIDQIKKAGFRVSDHNDNCVYTPDPNKETFRLCATLSSMGFNLTDKFDNEKPSDWTPNK